LYEAAGFEHLVCILDNGSWIIPFDDRAEGPYMNDVIDANMLDRDIFGESIEYAQGGIFGKMLGHGVMVALDVESDKESMSLVLRHVGSARYQPSSDRK
jgi:hypothetical protein